MARPARPERSKSARSSRQLSRFYHSINPDRVFGTHRTIEAGARQEVLSEIELELKSGNAGVLFDLGIQLLDAAPLRVGTRSKAERGYALAFDVVQPAAKAEPFGITAEHVVDD